MVTMVCGQNLPNFLLISKQINRQAFASSMVRLNRHLPDVRSDVCKNKTYSNLPKCSIVIPFHNEDWMLLIRTMHSVLNRSPLELVEEVLLVDDASSRG